MAQCNVDGCERADVKNGVLYRGLRLNGLRLEGVPLCEEHYATFAKDERLYPHQD